MPQLSAQRALLFTLVSLLVIYAAWLASIAPAPVSVSKVSARHALTSLPSPQTTKVAVPFGVRDSLLLLPVQGLDRNVTASSESVEGLKLSKRVLPSWKDTVKAGNKTIRLLEGHREQSVINNMEQIFDSGWTISDKANPIDDEYDEVYAALHINGNNNICKYAFQNFPFDNCRHKHNDPTGGKMRNVFNVPGRAIIADYNYGCPWQLKQPDVVDDARRRGLPPAEERLPDAWKWSDIVWNLWAEQAQDAAPTLKYIFRHHVITDSTKNIIELAAPHLVDQFGFFKGWPGITFHPGEEGFRALLGTPHGKGVAWMLIDRPYGLRDRNIESITMFVSDGEKYNLLFTLTD